MNSWVLVFLGGTNGTNVVIMGSYVSEDDAIIAAISTGSPWNWQPCQVWGPAVPPPMGTLSPQVVEGGAWVAIASMLGSGGNVQPVGYGTFASLVAAQAWAATQQNPAGYSYGYLP